MSALNARIRLLLRRQNVIDQRPAKQTFLPFLLSGSFSTFTQNGNANEGKTLRALPPKFPQEALDQLFIIKSKEPPPSSWSNLFEHFRNIDGSISVEVEHELLKRIADSKNRKLLQRATEQLEWNDAESLRLLIFFWARLFNEPQRAARLLLNWPNDIRPPTIQSFRLILMGLSEGTGADSRLATDVLKLLCDKYSPQLQPDRDCFHRVLRACANDPQAAEHVMLQMIQHAQKHDSAATMPNLSTYRLLFTAWANSNQNGAGTRAVELLRSCPVEPDTLCCNLVLNTLANEAEYDLAEGLVHEMLQKQLVDRISFYTLFKAYTNANTAEAAEQAQAFLHGMEANMEAFGVPHSVKLPNGRIYASVIGMWAKLGQTNRAWELLKQLEKRTTQPPNGRQFHADQICYHTIIGSLSKGSSKSAKKNAQRAQDLLESMSLKFRLNLRTCNTVLKCWARARDPHTAKKKVLDRMPHWGVAPDTVSYNTVMQAYARNGDAKQAEELLGYLLSPKSEIQPNFRTFTATLTALSKQKTFQAAKRAETLFLKMQELHEKHNMDTRPDIFSYNALLSCWALLGDAPKTEQVFREMEAPDIVSFNSVILAQRNSLEKAEKVVQEMMEHNINPDPVTQRTLMKVLKADKSISNKQEKANELKQKYFSE